MAAEYIEREKLMEALTEWQSTIIETYGEYDEYVQCIDSIMLGIDNAPAADVRPVVRAHWKPGDIRNVTAVCSNCGRLRLGNGAEWATKLAYFCEKCGADMRPEPPEEE